MAATFLRFDAHIHQTYVPLYMISYIYVYISVHICIQYIIMRHGDIWRLLSLWQLNLITQLPDVLSQL